MTPPEPCTSVSNCLVTIHTIGGVELHSSRRPGLWLTVDTDEWEAHLAGVRAAALTEAAEFLRKRADHLLSEGVAGPAILAAGVDLAANLLEALAKTSVPPPSATETAQDAPPVPEQAPEPQGPAETAEGFADHPLTLRLGKCGCGWSTTAVGGDAMIEHAAHVHVALGLAVEDDEPQGRAEGAGSDCGCRTCREHTDAFDDLLAQRDNLRRKAARLMTERDQLIRLVGTRDTEAVIGPLTDDLDTIDASNAEALRAVDVLGEPHSEPWYQISESLADIQPLTAQLRALRTERDNLAVHVKVRDHVLQLADAHRADMEAQRDTARAAAETYRDELDRTGEALLDVTAERDQLRERVDGDAWDRLTAERDRLAETLRGADPYADTGLDRLEQHLVLHWPARALGAEGAGQRAADLAIEVLRDLCAELAECHADLARMRPVADAAVDWQSEPVAIGWTAEQASPATRALNDAVGAWNDWASGDDREVARDRADILAAKRNRAEPDDRGYRRVMTPHGERVAYLSPGVPLPDGWTDLGGYPTTEDFHG